MNTRALVCTLFIWLFPLVVHASPDPLPIKSVVDFGAVPDDGLDDQLAIKAAFDSMTTGGTVVFPPGEYHHSAQLSVSKDGTRVSGYGATLVATDPLWQALRLVGRTRIEVLGLTLVSPATVRKSGVQYNAITVQSSSEFRVEDCTIVGSSAAGILITQDSFDYVIRNNIVTGTKADGIHNTGRSHHGLIVGNVIDHVEDDGIAVVSYVNDTAYTHHIQIAGNHVIGTSSGIGGRGITAVGGSFVDIIGNQIDGVKLAGVLVASEWSYNTYGAKDVTVRGNVLRDVSWAYPEQHGGIFVYARAGNTNERVLVDSNTVIDTVKGPGHLRLGPYGTEIVFTGNVIVDEDSSKPWAVVTDTTGLTYTITDTTYNGVQQ
jgi:hypothetical protein